MFFEQAEKYYQLLIDNAPEMFWILDLNEERFLYISPAVESIRGYTVEEMLQHKMYEVHEQRIRTIFPEYPACAHPALPARHTRVIYSMNYSSPAKMAA